VVPEVPLVGLTSHLPATDTTVTTSSTSYSDIDATNLAVSFVVPPSGAVLVRLSAYAISGGESVYAWGLREGSSDVASWKACVRFGMNNVADHGRRTTTVYIAGLTRGATKTWKWTHARVTTVADGAAACEIRYGVGSDRGPAIMEVWAA
jgi:hypothetical protein